MVGGDLKLALIEGLRALARARPRGARRGEHDAWADAPYTLTVLGGRR